MSEYTNERPSDDTTDLNLIREQCGTLELALQTETDPARLSGILAAAGFTDVACEAHTPAILLGGGLGLDDTVAWLTEGGMGKRFLGGADGPTAERAVAAVREALAPFVTPDGVRMATATWLVSATRP